MFSPSDFIEYQKRIGSEPKFKPPQGVIFCYQTRLKRYILEHHKTTQVAFAGNMHLLDETEGEIGVVTDFGVGAPIAVIILEELIAIGVRQFMDIGTAGTLQKNIDVGDIMVCNRAIRDEGTSHHYMKRSKYAYASETMTSKIIRYLETSGQKYFVGTSWTIDAPYRETIAEATRYQQEGVATVEMEAAALFAVGRYRNAEVGAVFTISDSLAELKWYPKFEADKTMKGLETVFKTAMSVLRDGIH